MVGKRISALILVGFLISACVPEETSIDMEQGPNLEEWDQDGDQEEVGDSERDDSEEEEAPEDGDLVDGDLDQGDQNHLDEGDLDGEDVNREEGDDDFFEEDRWDDEGDLDGAPEPEPAPQPEPEPEPAPQPEPEAEADGGLDLSCADDPQICRFCGPPVPVVQSCPDSNISFECQVFRLVNQERAANGLVEVTYNATLAESAMIHAMDLMHCVYFAHNSLDGTTFFQRCAENGYSGTCTGENIGGGQQTPQSVFNAWMNSSSHRANILYPHHRELGVAFYENSGGLHSRYWVKHFGRP